MTELGSINRIRLNQVLVDFAALKLQIDGIWYDIEARQLALLRLLINHPGQAVSRQQIMDAIWPDVVVSDNSVSQAITQLRKSLQEPKDSPTFIRTVPRKGYQLVADIQYLDAMQTEPLRISLQNAVLSTLSGILLCAFLAWALWPRPPESYQHKAQLTASPGDEAFLTLSHNHRYLLFTQQDEQSGLRDIMVYDRQSGNIHGIRQSGYDELSPAWSPEGNALAYIRQNAFSCQIRILDLSGPVETWRLAKDKAATDCQPDSGHKKLRWTESGLYYLDPLTSRLLRFDISSMSEQTSWQQVRDFDVDNSGQHLLLLNQHHKHLRLSYFWQDKQQTAELLRVIPPVATLKWQEAGQRFWLTGQQLLLADIHSNVQPLRVPPGFIQDVAQIHNDKVDELFLSSGNLQANLFTLALSSPAKLQALTSSPNMEYLPAISADGLQTAYISQYFDYVDQQVHQEVWVKHSHKPIATLISSLPEDIQPDFLSWSPQGTFLLLQDKRQRVFLLNLYARSYQPLLTDFTEVSTLYWQDDEQQLYFSALQQDKAIRGRLDLTKQQIDLIDDKENPAIPNPSFATYREQILTLMQQALPEVSHERLEQAFDYMRPALTSSELYFALPGLNQLDILVLNRQSGEVQLLHQLNRCPDNRGLPLSLAVNPEQQQLVISLLESQQNNLMLRQR
ncbi:winged helix-turn-helix domain-containing protein [Bowmanella denitrificans]|uniref:winged helix-turn-helix domain-containing protein n=1 Tax=Bowmanella denitrificans TaxID=366582 RepID=UPI001558DF40|nr:winged helix-turn-helix domain-containing protein [Bowmanella denitrificans]